MKDRLCKCKDTEGNTVEAKLGNKQNDVIGTATLSIITLSLLIKKVGRSKFTAAV